MSPPPRPAGPELPAREVLRRKLAAMGYLRVQVLPPCHTPSTLPSREKVACPAPHAQTATLHSAQALRKPSRSPSAVTMLMQGVAEAGRGAARSEEHTSELQ